MDIRRLEMCGISAGQTTAVIINKGNRRNMRYVRTVVMILAGIDIKDMFPKVCDTIGRVKSVQLMLMLIVHQRNLSMKQYGVYN